MKTMNQKEFQKLQREIHKAILKLGDLQKLHREQTGRDYVVGGWMPELKENEGDLMKAFICDICSVPTRYIK